MSVTYAGLRGQKFPGMPACGLLPPELGSVLIPHSVGAQEEVRAGAMKGSFLQGASGTQLSLQWLPPVHWWIPSRHPWARPPLCSQPPIPVDPPACGAAHLTQAARPLPPPTPAGAATGTWPSGRRGGVRPGPLLPPRGLARRGREPVPALGTSCRRIASQAINNHQGCAPGKGQTAPAGGEAEAEPRSKGNPRLPLAGRAVARRLFAVSAARSCSPSSHLGNVGAGSDGLRSPFRLAQIRGGEIQPSPDRPHVQRRKPSFRQTVLSLSESTTGRPMVPDPSVQPVPVSCLWRPTTFDGCCQPPFTDGQPEAQTSRTACPRSHSKRGGAGICTKTGSKEVMAEYSSPPIEQDAECLLESLFMLKDQGEGEALPGAA